MADETVNDISIENEESENTFHLGPKSVEKVSIFTTILVSLCGKNRARAFNIWTPPQKQPRFQYSGEFINVIQ